MSASTAYADGLKANQERYYREHPEELRQLREHARTHTLSTTNIAGESVKIIPNARMHRDLIEWLREPSVSHPELTNEQFLMQFVMPDIEYYASMPVQVFVSKPWWRDFAKNLVEYDPQTIVGRMGITPNGGICRHRMIGIHTYLCVKYHMGAMFYREKLAKRLAEEGPRTEVPVVREISPLERPNEAPSSEWRPYQMLVMNKAIPDEVPAPDPDADCGWLSPEGVMYPCKMRLHERLRYALEKKFNIRNFEQRWCKRSEDQERGTMYWYGPDGYATRAQRDFIHDWCVRRGVEPHMENDRVAIEAAASKYHDMEISRRIDAHGGD